MPDFEKTKNFPRNCDNLHSFLVKSWNKLLFVGFDPIIDIEEVIRYNEPACWFFTLR